MVYILMIYADEANWVTKTEAEMAPVMQAHEALEQSLRKAGKYRGCGGLAPTTAAASLRVRNGKPLRVDGPYAESKEQFGGYYLVEAESIDEAMTYAARIPGVGDHTIEVRPVMDFRSA